MDRRRLEAGAVAVLTVLVVGVAAATLGATTRRSTGGGGAGGDGGGAVSVSVATESTQVARDPLPVFVLVVAVLLLVLAVAAVRYPLHTLLEVGKSLAMAGVVLVALWLLFLLVGVGRFPQGGPGDDLGGIGVVPLGEGGGAPTAVATSRSPELLVLVVVALVGLGLLGVAARNAAADGDGDAVDEETLAAIGHSAGRAADRLAAADADLDNEVYRAWREMTGHLEVDSPESRTPGEFRTAALSAGMARRDVETLTDLFEAVRYGGAAPTEDREATATESLRRIENRYADRQDDAASRGAEGPP